MDCPFNKADRMSVLRNARDGGLWIIQLRKFLRYIGGEVNVCLRWLVLQNLALGGCVHWHALLSMICGLPRRTKMPGFPTRAVGTATVLAQGRAEASPLHAEG